MEVYTFLVRHIIVKKLLSYAGECGSNSVSVYAWCILCIIPYTFGLKYEEPCVIYVTRKKMRSHVLLMVNALCAAYLCKKNVWENNDKYQCKMKNAIIKYILMFCTSGRCCSNRPYCIITFKKSSVKGGEDTLHRLIHSVKNVIKNYQLRVVN